MFTIKKYSINKYATLFSDIKKTNLVKIPLA